MRIFVLVCLFLRSSWLLAQAIDSMEIRVKGHTTSLEYPYDQDLLGAEFYRKNREALLDSLPYGSMVAVFSNSRIPRSEDVYYPFQQNNNFLYLTGLNEPNSLLLLFKKEVLIDGWKGRTFLIAQAPDTIQERWNGPHLGRKGIQQHLGIEKVIYSETFSEIPISLSGIYQIYVDIPLIEGIDDFENRGDLPSLKKHFFTKIHLAEKDSIVDNGRLKYYFFPALRQIKSEEELKLIQKAVDITVGGLIYVMETMSEHHSEFEVQASLEYLFKINGAEEPAFPSIVGSGENSCILHYQSNRKMFKDSDLVVCDVGAAYHQYKADITRTLPVSGKFTKEQAQIYQLVLDAQKAGIEACVVGNKFWDPHLKCKEVIEDGLKELGVIRKKYLARDYFIHGSSHYLGLDVHDIGLFGSLKSGNVITVEPGIYIPKGSDCDPKWWGIGVRIEDDILIQETEPKVLSSDLPKEIEEIERLSKKVK